MADAWLGKAIADYLKENRYSQAYINRETGIARSKISQSLKGKRRFTFDEYILICKSLGLGTDYFLKSRFSGEKGA